MLIQAFGLNQVQIILFVNDIVSHDICGTCLIINNYDILMFAHELKNKLWSYSKLPTWLKTFAPKSSLKIQEESWTAYPKSKTGQCF